MEITCQVLVVGDHNTGKSHLVATYFNNSPEQCDFGLVDDYCTELTVSSKKVLLKIADFSEEMKSFKNVKEIWIPQLMKYRSSVPYILVATKVDTRIEGSSDFISKEQGEKLAKEIGAFCYLETSAKEGTHAKDVFDILVESWIPKDKITNLCLKGDLEAVEAFCNTHPESINNVEIVKSKQLTPLGVAAMEGNLELAKILLDNGAHVSFGGITSIVNTALYYACENKKKEIVDEFLKLGAYVDYESITKAEEWGNQDVIQKLKNTRQSQKSHQNELIEAVKKGDLETVKKIVIKYGMIIAEDRIDDGKEGGDETRNAVVIAIEKNNADMITFFTNGALPSESLCLAAISSGNVDLLKKFLEIMAPCDDDVELYLTKAVAKEQTEVLEFLYNLKGDFINPKLLFPSNLVTAAEKGEVKIFKYLLNKVDSIIASIIKEEGEEAIDLSKNDMLACVLQKAILAGQYEICKEILTQDGIPLSDSFVWEGNTALHLAAENGHKKICELLLKPGKSLIHQANKDGKLPKDVAKDNDISKLLQEVDNLTLED